MATTQWTLDATHSELNFKIRHLMITNVSGSFTDFTVDVTTDGDDFSTAQIGARIKMDSINTNNQQRDHHLRASDFFDAANHPEMIFKSTRVEKRSNDEFLLHGDLTMKGTTQPVQLNVEFGGITKDPWGSERAGFTVTGKINRSAWGVSFNSVLETGGVALGEEVKIASEIQLVKQVAVAPSPTETESEHQKQTA